MRSADKDEEKGLAQAGKPPALGVPLDLPRGARVCFKLPPSPPESPGGPFSLPHSLPSPSGLGPRAAPGPAAPASAAIRSLWSAGDAAPAPRGVILSALTAPGRGAHRLNPAALAAPVAAAAAAATEAALAVAGTAVIAGGPVARAPEGPSDPEGVFPDPEGFLDPDPPSATGVQGSRFVWAHRRPAEPESAAVAPDVARTALLPSSVAVRL